MTSDSRPHPNPSSSLAPLIAPLAGFVIIVAGLRAASAIVVPFLLSVFFTIILSPVLVGLRRLGMRRGLAILVVILLALLVGIFLVYLVGSSVEDFAGRIPRYQAGLQSRMQDLLAALQARGWDLSEDAVTEYLNLPDAIRMIGNTVTGLAAALTNAFFIILTVGFMLAEAAALPAKLQAAFPGSRSAMHRLNVFFNSFNRYLAIKTAISLGTGISAWALVGLLRIDFPILWGMLAFVLNYVPNIGSIIAAVPPVLLAIVLHGPGVAFLTLAGYLGINTLFGSVLEPRWMGRGLGLSPLVVFLSLVFWGWVLGPVGMLLSVPLTMVLKLGLESYADTRWIAVLLGAAAPEPGAPRGS